MHFAGHMQFAALGVDEVDRMALGILGIISYIVHLTSEQEYPGWTFAELLHMGLLDICISQGLLNRFQQICLGDGVGLYSQLLVL